MANSKEQAQQLGIRKQIFLRGISALTPILLKWRGLNHNAGFWVLELPCNNLAASNNGSECHNPLRHECGLLAGLTEYFEYRLLLVSYPQSNFPHLQAHSGGFPSSRLDLKWGLIFLQDFEEAYSHVDSRHKGKLPVQRIPGKNLFNCDSNTL